jgi:hypothetical protein
VKVVGLYQRFSSAGVVQAFQTMARGASKVTLKLAPWMAGEFVFSLTVAAFIRASNGWNTCFAGS